MVETARAAVSEPDGQYEISQRHAEILLQLTCLMIFMSFECIELLTCTLKSSRCCMKCSCYKLGNGSMAQYGCNA